MGSLAGAAHLLKNNTDDLRSIQYEQKSHVEFKCRSGFDFDLQIFCQSTERSGLMIL